MAESRCGDSQSSAAKDRSRRSDCRRRAGVGITAKCEEAGGIDLIVIYNSGRFRMAGHGSLAGLMPFGDANAIVLEMAAEGVPVVKKTPAWRRSSPPTDAPDGPLQQVQAAGFAGVQNFPTVGLIDGAENSGRAGSFSPLNVGWVK